MRGGLAVQGATALVAGAIGAGIVAFTAPGGPKPGELATAEGLARLEARRATLEQDAATARRERDAAQKQVAEAFGAAVESKRDTERLRERVDELLGLLDGAGGRLAGGPGGAKFARLGGVGSRDAAAEGAPG